MSIEEAISLVKEEILDRAVAIAEIDSLNDYYGEGIETVFRFQLNDFLIGDAFQFGDLDSTPELKELSDDEWDEVRETIRNDYEFKGEAIRTYFNHREGIADWWYDNNGNVKVEYKKEVEED